MKLNNATKLIISLFFSILCLNFSSIYLNKKDIKTYIFDRNYSFFLQDKNNISYNTLQTKRISSNREIVFAKILTPVFVSKKNDNEVYLSAHGDVIEFVSDKHKNNLITLDYDLSSFTFVYDTYQAIKKYKIVSMLLIDKRRWQITILKNDKLIIIDFPIGVPNMDEFESIDEKYSLTKKYHYIDMRFGSKIGVFK
jgi:hypothetical protein